MAKTRSTSDLLDKLKRLRKRKDNENSELKVKIEKVIRKLDKRVDAIQRKLAGEPTDDKRQALKDELLLIEVQRRKAIKVIEKLESPDE